MIHHQASTVGFFMNTGITWDCGVDWGEPVPSKSPNKASGNKRAAVVALVVGSGVII